MRLSRWKRISFVAMLSLFGLVALCSWAFASPVGAAPDDDYHLASIWCSWGDREALCGAGQTADERVVQERLVASSACYAFNPGVSAACEISDKTYVSTDRGNFDGSYPPFFYATMGLFAGTEVAEATLLMRVLNAVLFVGVVTALILMLKRGERAPLIWGVSLAAVPLGMFIIPSVNPSSWAVLSGATLWVALVGYFRATSLSMRIAFAGLSLLLAFMGAGARADSAAYVAIATLVATILTFKPEKRWWILSLLPLALLLVGAYFFLTSGQAGSVTVAEPTGTGQSLGAVLRGIIANILQLPSLWIGGLGYWGLGWIDTVMPPIVWGTTSALFAAVTFWGIRVLGIRKAAALALVAFALVAVPLWVLVREQILVGQGVQPRYILPLMFMLAGVAVYGLKRDSLGMTKVQSLVVFLGLAVTNSCALFVNMRRYITGIDYTGLSLDSSIEWWWAMPVSPMTVWFIGSASFSLLLLGFFLMIHHGPKENLTAPEVVELRPTTESLARGGSQQ